LVITVLLAGSAALRLKPASLITWKDAQRIVAAATMPKPGMLRNFSLNPVTEIPCSPVDHKCHRSSYPFGLGTKIWSFTVVIGCQDQIRPTMSESLAVSAYFVTHRRLLVPVSIVTWYLCPFYQGFSE